MPTTPVPRVETARLLLREWHAADIDEYAAMCADAEVMRYLGGVGALDRAQSWRRMALAAGHWQLRGYGNWAVERKDDRAMIGSVGLWNPEGWPGLEVGWTLSRQAWGHGYATEAGRAAIEWAWTELAVSRLISVIHPENAASQRVAARLGLRSRGEQLLQSPEAPDGITVAVYEIERST